MSEDIESKELNDRQLAFIREYVVDLSPADAAMRAGYTDNREAARVQGYRLLENATVRSEIERILNESSRAQIPEIIAENIKMWREMANNSELSPKDRLKASELAGKYAAMFVDKVEVKNDGPVVIRYDDGNSKAE